MNLLGTFLALAVLTGTAALGAHPAQQEQTPPPGPQLSGRNAPVRELPLPDIPPTLREPRERAAYLLRHFWDAMEFTDTLRSRDRAGLEQHFADFASLFPHADTAAVASSIDSVLLAASADRPALDLLIETAEKYLWEPDSPLCDDGYYMLFLERMLRSPALDRYEKLRPAYRLEAARRNRVGSTAADFVYTDRGGHPHTLRDTRGELLLLLFYDPDCDHCMKTIASLRRLGPLQQAVESGLLTVLALFADGDPASWHTPALPEGWIDGLDATGVQERELYAFKRLPALYLLDRDKRVLAKEPDPETLAQLLIQRLNDPPVGAVDHRTVQ